MTLSFTVNLQVTAVKHQRKLLYQSMQITLEASTVHVNYLSTPSGLQYYLLVTST